MLRKKEKQTKPTIGFIGAGNMAKAIIDAVMFNGYKDIIVFDPNQKSLLKIQERAKAVGERQVKIASSNQEVVDSAGYIFICVKPQIAKEILRDLRFAPEKVVISIMAGITLDKLKVLTDGKKIVRVMPNMNAVVYNSYNAYCGKGLNIKEDMEVFHLLNAFGTPAAMEEEHIDTVTGIAGSGPAYVFRFIKGLILAAEKEGLNEEDAGIMARDLLIGAADVFAKECGIEGVPMPGYAQIMEKLDSLADSVCSKGGTTIEGIKHLDSHNFSGLVKEAAMLSTKRARELSQG